LSPLEVNIDYGKPLPEFFKILEKAYPYATKKKVTIIRIWKCIPTVLCWQIWLTRNKCIFKNQNPRIGKTLSKTWVLTSEIFNEKGTAPTDYSILQQEEREWLNKAIIDNNGKKGQRKESSRKNWKLRITKEEIESWKRLQNRYCLQFDGASKNNPRKAGAGGIIFYPSGKKLSHMNGDWDKFQIIRPKRIACSWGQK